jgi:transcriptional regulator with XRE-family HTH domain
MQKNLNHIKDWRNYRHLTQEQLGGRVGCSKSHISQIENGKGQFSQPLLYSLAEALSCDVGDLFSPPPMPDQPESEFEWYKRKLERLKEHERGRVLRILKAALDDDEGVA